jgi:phosphoserine phosphatase
VQDCAALFQFKIMIRKHYLFLSAIIFLVSCNQADKNFNQQTESEILVTDPLPTWNEGPAKQSVIDFVKAVTNEAGADFINPADRIAVFDNDGTLWSEQPYYFQLQFAFDRVKAMADDHPEWKTNPLIQAVLADELNTVLSFGEKGLAELVMTTHAGMTTDEFSQSVTDWITTSKHPKTGKLYKEMVFQPMLEVLEFLQANGFKTYIVSGGGIDFMRPWTEEVYGIPAEQVIGSSVKTAFEMRNGKPVLVKLPELNFFDDKEGKPVAIHQHIGKKPVAAFGNSDGDLQMLQWTSAGNGRRLMVFIHHTDADREWAYNRESHIGRFDKGLDEAMAKGWTIVDMKKNWKVIYPFELTP